MYNTKAVKRAFSLSLKRAKQSSWKTHTSTIAVNDTGEENDVVGRKQGRQQNDEVVRAWLCQSEQSLMSKPDSNLV